MTEPNEDQQRPKPGALLVFLHVAEADALARLLGRLSRGKLKQSRLADTPEEIKVTGNALDALRVALSDAGHRPMSHDEARHTKQAAIEAARAARRAVLDRADAERRAAWERQKAAMP